MWKLTPWSPCCATWVSLSFWPGQQLQRTPPTSTWPWIGLVHQTGGIFAESLVTVSFLCQMMTWRQRHQVTDLWLCLCQARGLRLLLPVSLRCSFLVLRGALQLNLLRWSDLQPWPYRHLGLWTLHPQPCHISCPCRLLFLHPLRFLAVECQSGCNQLLQCLWPRHLLSIMLRPTLQVLLQDHVQLRLACHLCVLDCFILVLSLWFPASVLQHMFPLQLTMRCLHTLFFPLLHRPSIHLLRLQTGLQFLSRMLLSVCQEQRAAKTLPIQVNLESSFHIFLLRFPRHAF